MLITLWGLIFDFRSYKSCCYNGFKILTDLIISQLVFSVAFNLCLPIIILSRRNKPMAGSFPESSVNP